MCEPGKDWTADLNFLPPAAAARKALIRGMRRMRSASWIGEAFDR